MDALVRPQAQAELEFWKGLVHSVGPEYYYAYRSAEYYDKTRFFPSFPAQTGKGLDVGCGCVSVFEPSLKDVAACDPLWAEYAHLLLPCGVVDKLTCAYGVVADETLPYHKDSFDWVACLNMIDHTPNSHRMITEIRRVLKPGGTLYFEVNFEAGLAPPHYQIWNEQMVVNHICEGWARDHMIVQPVPEHKQHRYWAEYRRLA